MKITSKSGQERLAEVQQLYSKACSVSDPQRMKFKQWDAQYRGDHQIDGPTLDDEGEEVNVPKKADVVWNISFELLEGSIDTNIPQPFVTPELKCEHHIRNARRVENLIKMLMDKHPFEIYNDSEERTVKKFGLAGMEIEWDVESGTHSEVGEIHVSTLRPVNIYPQPGITSIDDCDYVFVNYITTKAALKRKFSLSDEDIENTYLEPTYDSGSDSSIYDEDVVTLTVMWYRGEKGDICRFSYSGDIILEDDDDYYSRKVEYCKTCGRRRQICEKDECSSPDYYLNKLDYDELCEDIQCSDGRIIPAYTPEFKDGEMVYETVRMPVTAADGSQAMGDVGGVELPAFMEVQIPKMKKTRLPYYKPQKLPLSVRYNIKDDDSFWGISDMEVIREQQQECNKLTSRIHEAIMRSGAALFKPKGTEVALSNGVFDNIIDIDNSVDKNQFGLFSYSVDVSQWLIERNNHKEQAKRLLGISDSFLGQADNTAKSGYAKSVQVQQSAGRLASKKMMKQAHYADVFRIIFELYLAFADEPRQIHHEDNSDCALAAEERFNRYDFYEFDGNVGKWYIDDNYTFAVDPNGALEQQYPQLWELVKQDYASGMYGEPTQLDSQICAWRHLEQLRYPFARNIVEMKKQQRDQMMAQAMKGQMSPGTEGQGGGAAGMPQAVQGMNTQGGTRVAPQEKGMM